MPRIENDIKLDFKDVLIKPKRSTLITRADAHLHRNFTFKNSNASFEGIPIIAANMDTVGTFEMATTLNEVIPTNHNLSKCAKSVAVSTGTAENSANYVSSILNVVPEIQYICIDVANGYSESFVDNVRKFRETYPKKTIIAGNVVTCEMVEELILSGADIVKIGIGPGSVCTTRKKTGIGYPQLSAVLECADAAHGLNGHVLADGGCAFPGDVVKAFGAGADFVMLGGMLAGHDQSGGEICENMDGTKYKLFYGMASSTAMQKYAGAVSNYKASEGKTVKIEYKGDVRHTVQDILGGLRSACTYVGAKSLKELSKRTTFIRVTQQTNEIFAVQTIQTHHGYEQHQKPK